LSESEARALAGEGTAAPVTPETTSVLVVGPSVTEMSHVQSFLTPFGFQAVDTFDHSTGTPTLTQVQAYDAVVVFTSLGPNDPVLLGDVLADFLDGGGGLVTGSYVHSGSGIDVQGRFQTGGFSPFNFNDTNPNSITSLGTVYLPDHPIMANIATLTTTSNTDPTLAPGGTPLADWATGITAVAVNTPGTVASITQYVGNATFYSGDIPQLFTNAILFTVSN